MLNLRYVFSFFSIGLLSFLLAPNVYADATISEVVTTPVTEAPQPQVIVTPVPAPKEVVTTPKGYVTCFTVDAGWYQNEWVPAHRACQYEKVSEGVVWIDGYWACSKYTVGECTNWVWKAGRWVKTFSVF